MLSIKQAARYNPNSPLTCAMIVKDEAHNLPRCLESVKPFVRQIVIHDTGSTDDSVEIAQGFEAVVRRVSWNDHFSIARNTVAALCDTDLILVVDADEVLSGDVEQLLDRLKDPVDFYTCRVANMHEGREIGAADQARIYHRDRLHYVGRVHNELTPFDGLPSARGEALGAALSIRHYGYGDGGIQRKNTRNLHLLLMAYDEGDRRPQVIFHLARCLSLDGRRSEAFELFRGLTSRTDLFGEMSAVVLANEYAAEATAHTLDEPHLQRCDELLDSIQRLVRKFPNNPEILRAMLTLYRILDIRDGATRTELLIKDAPKTWGGAANVEFYR